jgi:GNAT superfamily N-acetyltransferase
MIIRKAAFTDIDTLIKLRIGYLAEDIGLSSDEEDTIKAQLVNYFTKHIGDDFIAALAEVEGKAVSTAFLVVTEVPANPHFMTGKTATILNIYTIPEYRRLGIATRVLRYIIDIARQSDVAFIDLKASVAGKSLYKMLGFSEPELATSHVPMRLKLT